MIPDTVFTLDKAKAHLRVDHNAEDALITAMLDAAVGAVERYTRRAWTAREWSVPVDAADLDCCSGSDVFHALLSPATAEVFTFDAMGADVPVPAADVVVSTRFGHSVVNVSTWPTGVEVGPVGRIDYSAAPPNNEVPPDVYAAVMLYLGDLYENREAQVIGVAVAQNATAAMLLRPYVIEMHA